ncbi:MAG TPA: S8 family serine peptidase [Longimicrobiales bacterium]
MDTIRTSGGRRLALGLFALALAACGDDDAPLDPGDVAGDTLAPPPAFEVDPQVEPAVAQILGFDGQTPRPVASIVDESGNQADFVENELWLSTDDASELEGFLSRWDGEVVNAIDPSGTALDGLPKQYLVRVTAASADLDALAADLRALDPYSTGTHRVSSQRGLALLAAGAAEAAGGLAVGVNWVGRPTAAFRNEESIEAPVGPPGYDPDVFNWPTHMRGGKQDIGVTAAWRALDFANKLGNQIDLLILDKGFQNDRDWRPTWDADATVAGIDPIGAEYSGACGGACVWHGTNVFSAAMAVPGNGYGSAGPAGPIADPAVLYLNFDLFSLTYALARLRGVDIINMSTQARVPFSLGWSVLPFDAATAIYRETGTLIFASAGNDGDDVDGKDCVGAFGLDACWEEAWYTPCENSGVICVGGLAWNSTARAAASNYGDEHVDIYAPFTLWLGPDPAHPENEVRAVSGTSYSSPFAAGVAALIWAADPGLDADDVERILYETAHTPREKDVKRYVNAYAAVHAALGNVPPGVEIASPDDGTTHPVNVAVSFNALVEDIDGDGPDCCTLVWSSDVDGPLGIGLAAHPVFATTGDREITVTARDAGGATGTASITIHVVNTPPSPTIVRPTPGEEVIRGRSIVLRGSAHDPNEMPDAVLDCAGLTWTSSAGDAAFPVTGCEPEVAFTTNGSRTLTLTATDSHGGTDSVTVDIAVVDPPPDLPPVVQVASPANGVSIGPSTELTLAGDATDPEGQTSLTYEWFVVYPYNTGTGTGENTAFIGSGPVLTWKPSETIPIECETYYQIRIELRVTDPGGNTGKDFVVGTVNLIC